MKLITLPLLLLALVGCEANIGRSTLADAEQARLKTQHSFANPIEVAKLSDGRVVYLSYHYTVEGDRRAVYLTGTTLTTDQVLVTENGKKVVMTTVGISQLGELTIDQKVRKAGMLTTEAQRLVDEAAAVSPKNRVVEDRTTKAIGTKK